MLKYDEVGYWSEIKLDILREYASAYSQILSAQNKFHHVYIDAFAGAGTHISRTSGEEIPGSPIIALGVRPPFTEYHFIDLDTDKAVALRKEVGPRDDVFIYNEDCNSLLLNNILPKIKYEQFRRALCILDPYGLHLDWRVLALTGRLGTCDIFLNFPVADMNRNVLWRARDGVSESQIARMNRFWGDGSWREIAYRKERNLFFEEEIKNDNDQVANGFAERLKKVAGFAHVPKPLPMKNSSNAIVYYLFFASNKPVAAGIVSDIFKKYANKL